MTEAQDKFNAATQRHSDALQRAIDRERASVTLQADNAALKAGLAKAQADYDALLTRTADYLSAAAEALDTPQAPAELSASTAAQEQATAAASTADVPTPSAANPAAPTPAAPQS